MVRERDCSVNADDFQPATPLSVRIWFGTISGVEFSDQHSASPVETTREEHAVTIGRIEDLPVGRAATVELPGGKELALFNVDGNFYAIDNSCPHKGAPLAEGNVCEHVIECDWHGWRFDLRTGECLTNCGEVETYEVRIENGEIKIVV